MTGNDPVSFLKYDFLVLLLKYVPGVLLLLVVLWLDKLMISYP